MHIVPQGRLLSGVVHAHPFSLVSDRQIGPLINNHDSVKIWAAENLTVCVSSYYST